MTGVAAARLAVDVPRRLRPVCPVIASAGAALTLVAVLALLVPGPELPIVFAHMVVLVLSSGAAYLLDDSAAQVTSVVPRSLLRRRLAVVALGLLVAAAGWGVVAPLLNLVFPSIPIGALTWEVAGLFWIGVAASAVVSHHDIEPGNLVASTLGLLFVGMLISRPLPHITLLVSNSGDPAHVGWWALAILGSVGTLVVASRQ